MVTRKFKTWRDPYDQGFSPCRPREIEIQDGLTIFVGCNGAGKSTLMRCIEESLKKEKIPILSYNNLQDGGHNSLSSVFYQGNYELGASLWTASEGEAISINVGGIFKQVQEFILTGETDASKKQKKWDALFKDEESSKPKEPPKERWILLDAVDSGLSIDNILDLKYVFNLIIEDAKKAGVNIFIVAVANEYELANGENCFDVMSGKYLKFKDYDDYKKFVVKSRQKKDKRYKN